MWSEVGEPAIAAACRPYYDLTFVSGKSGGPLPETMHAAVYRGPRDVVVEERPVPELGPRDVLLEVSHCGVCGSDLHMFVDGWGAPDSIGGHEYSGRVVAVGDDVRDWSPGDEVVGGPSQRCGECEYCLAGRPQLCTGRNAPGVGEFQGAFANFVRVHEAEILRVPPGVSMRAAALAEPLAVALHGLTRGGVEAGQRVLVTGCGPIGALSIAAARARGVTDIVASEPHPTRQALARRLGATVVTPDDLPKPRMPFDLVDDPFDVALECSGHGVAMESALSQLKRGGTQWCRGKTFDTFAPIGPCLVTPDSLPLSSGLRIQTVLNGRVVQDANTREMIFDVPTLIEFLSRGTTLPPGTLIFTGTPQGVALGQKSPRWLADGDEVRVVIEGIGTLVNPVRQA